MNIPEIIPAEVTGYCDLETGECVTLDKSLLTPLTSGDEPNESGELA